MRLDLVTVLGEGCERDRFFLAARAESTCFRLSSRSCFSLRTSLRLSFGSLSLCLRIRLGPLVPVGPLESEYSGYAFEA